MSKLQLSQSVAVACFVASLGLGPVSVFAQQSSEVQAFPLADAAQSAPAKDLFIELISTGKNGIEFSLKEFVQWVALRNSAVLSAKLQKGVSEKLVEAEQALYEPVGYTRARHDDYDHPRTYEEITQSLTNISKSSAIEALDTGTFGLRGKLPTGATFDMSYDMRRRFSNLLSSSTTPEYRGTLTVSLKQPLLRGFGPGATETDLRVAIEEQKIEQQKFIKQLLDTTGESIGVYWQLSRAQQTLQMRQRAVANAKDLKETVQRLVRGGFSPKVDLFESEALIGSRMTELAKAEQTLVEANARVRNLLNLNGSAYLKTKFNVQDRMPQRDADTAMLNVSFDAPEDLLEHWPGYQIAKIKYDQEKIKLEYAENLEQPDLSLEAGYNLNSLQSRIHNAISDITDQPQHRGWYYGLSLEVPLGNTGASSKRQAQWLKSEAARVQTESEANTASNEWIIRVGQLNVARRECSQLQQDVQMRQSLLQSERLNYEQGHSRIRALIEAEDRLQDSMLRLLDGESRLRTAEVAVRALMGGFFASLGVTVQLQ
jgi:outer membrane protein